MARVPPGTGAGERVARGGRGKGILIHRLTDGAGMPLAHCTTPSDWDERAQVIPLLDALRLRTGKRGRPRTRLKMLAADKGDDAKALRRQRRNRGIRARIPKRVWQTKTPRGKPINMEAPCFQAERTCAWFPKKDRRLVVLWERIAACVDACLALATIHIGVQKLRVGCLLKG
jgi:hypothetical protein